jgi:sulfur dioxygenase
MSFVWAAEGAKHVFTGDTLLINGCGRTDFQSGSAEDLYRSITQVLFALPEDTTVWPGHDYKGRTHSTIGHEKATTPGWPGKPGRVCGHHGRAEPAPTQTHRRSRARQPTLDRRLAARPMACHCRKPVRHRAMPAMWPRRWPGNGCRTGEAVLVDVRTDAEREWVGRSRCHRRGLEAMARHE